VFLRRMVTFRRTRANSPPPPPKKTH
jgi:hypothetical protein